MTGKLITIEGIDGVGKTTHTNRLIQHLQNQNLPIVYTYEPGGTPIADRIRAIIRDEQNAGMSQKAELMLFLSSRAEHIQKVIKPSLQQGKIVICDRFIDSTIAYQGYGQGLDIDILHTLNAYVTDSIVPDLTIWLDLDPQLGFARKGGKDTTDRMETYNHEFYNRVYQGFATISAQNPRIAQINASGTVEQTHQLIIQQVDKIL